MAKKTDGCVRIDIWLPLDRKVELDKLSGDLAVPARDLASLAICRMLNQRDLLLSSGTSRENVHV